MRFLSDLAHAIEYAVDRCARGECPLRGQLIDNSIRERIGERESKLDQVRAGFFESKDKIDSPLQVWIAGANVGDEALALFGAQLPEAIVDSVFHE